VKKPDPFLTVRVHDLAHAPSITGLCTGYEQGSWRAVALADHIMEWLPEFSLTAAECEELGHHNAIKLLKKAANRVYATDKFARRGEFGEILLHAAIRQVFDSYPVISKIYYKTSPNDTVKGFDAVHVVATGKLLELWLGEAKFYDSISRAIADVAKDLERHTRADYLRTEFALILDKIDPQWPHASTIRRLLQPQTSLDEVFERACIPVLLTYDSPCISDHNATTSAYKTAFEKEIRMHWAAFSSKQKVKELRVHLFLLPLNSKVELLEILDRKLKSYQAL